MPASQAAQLMRNRVSFEAYVDLTFGLDRNAPGDVALILHQAMQGVHVAIVGGCRLAVAFPDRRAGDSPTLGRILRLVGSEGDLAAALGEGILRGLILSRLLKAEAIRPVPPDASEGIAYTRARPDKFLSMNWDRMDRRARARRKAGRCNMDEEDLLDRRRQLAQRSRDLPRLPSVSLSSRSTGQRFTIYVAASAGRPNPDGFTSYGLSAGSGAVPVF